MSKRDTAIALARVAGYHQDSRAFTRLIIESQVRRDVMNEAWRAGVRAREAGVRCGCRECSNPAVPVRDADNQCPTCQVSPVKGRDFPGLPCRYCALDLASAAQ
jgi:hypothetical protein